ncbi:hypothetical protein IF650_00695 [Cellulosimicrobium terreum]|nr:hypothetical protein [Cellulosimicrobium terreum]
MNFLENILTANRTPGWASLAGSRPQSTVGEGIESADVAFYGPMTLLRRTETRPEEL